MHCEKAKYDKLKLYGEIILKMGETKKMVLILDLALKKIGIYEEDEKIYTK